MRRLVLSALLLTIAAPAFAQATSPSDTGYARQDLRDQRRDDRADFRDERRDERDGRRDDNRDDRRDFRDDRRDYRDDRRDYRDDRRDYRQDERAGRYRGSVFVYPQGYGYRAYAAGYRLPRAFWGSRYYVMRPADYRLPQAARGLRWVRVGPDALLIKNWNGEVVRVVRSLFY